MTRLWRRRNVIWLAVVLAFALVAAACGNEDAEETTTTAAVPEETTTTGGAPQSTTATTAIAETSTTLPADEGNPYGGEVIVAEDQEPSTLNPFAPGGDELIVSVIGQSYLAGAAEIDGDTLEFIPELLVELPSVDNGGVVVNDDGTMTVNYTIREEAVWADGVPVSGADFQYTFEVIMDPDVPVDKRTYRDIIDTDVGDKTFSYTLSAPSVLYELTFNVLIPKHAVEGSDFASDWNETMWPSVGPFVLDVWETGDFLRVVRNDSYWKADSETGQQLPYLDSVVFRFLPEVESIINAFQGREVDIIQPPSTNETIAAMQALEPEGARVEVRLGNVWEHVNFQFGPERLAVNEDTINDNLAYRQAVAHAIDRDLIVEEILDGQVEPLDSFLEPGAPSIATDAWAQYDYNPERALELLEQARTETDVTDVRTVFSTTSNNDARVQLSELLVDMFSAVGITYENALEDSQLFFGETLDTGTWDLGEWAWRSNPGLSGSVALFNLFDPEAPPPEGLNFYRWGTPDSSVIDEHTARFAELRDEMNLSVDAEVLVPLMQEGEQLLADQMVILPLYAHAVASAVWADEVGGFKSNPTKAGNTWNMEEWYRVDL